MSPQRPATIDELGVTGAYHFAALLAAQQQRLPIAPTRRLALTVLDTLQAVGVIEVPWPDARWAIRPDAEETPIEHLQWCYSWPECRRPGLVAALCEFLEELSRDDYGLALRCRYWEELSAAESEQFFEQQLIKHQFDGSWAQDFIFVYRELRSQLSIAQWRYCCWAATRQGASVALQQRAAAPALVRESIYTELRQRAARLGTGAWSQCAFPPGRTLPDSALSRLFVTHLSKLGPDFWTFPSNAEHVLFRSQARG